MPNPGDKFEIVVERFVRDELENGGLGIHPKNGKVFRRKGYYSRDREKDIVTDVSLEIYRTDEDSPWLTWVYECKDYTGSIPVDDIEEFSKKLDQLGDHNFKGAIVARNKFASGCVTLAKKWGISLIRLLPDEEIRLCENDHDIEGLVMQCLTNDDEDGYDYNFYMLMPDGTCTVDPDALGSAG